jgi:hypothetical protein
MGIHTIPTENALQTTLGGTLSLAETGSFTIADDWSSILSGLSATRPIMFVVDRVNTNNEKTPTTREYILATGISGTTVSGLTRGQAGSTQQAHSAGAIVEIVWDSVAAKSITDALVAEHQADGDHAFDINYDANGNELLKFATTADAVNEITVTNAATAGSPVISATGGDDNVSLRLQAKGTGKVQLNRSVCIQVYDGADSLTIGNGKAYFTIPSELNGMNLTAVHAQVITAGTTNSTTIQIANVTDAVDMLSTVMSIETTETSTATSASPGVIDATKDDVATNDLIRIDIDAVSTTAPKGLIVRLEFGF